MDAITISITPEPFITREDIVLTDGRPSINEDNDNALFPPVENRYGVFDNSRINGVYTMIVSILYNPYLTAFPIDFEIIKQEVKVKLLSISEMQYFYLKALNIYDSIDYDDYFNLPVKFPSNVNGGIGIVGVSTGSNVVLELESIK